MPDTRGRPQPAEVLAVLKDPSITNWLSSFIIAKTSAESIGRYPGLGSAQNDIYVYPDAADATHPYNFDYLIAANFQRIISAKLSFFIRAYRTYNTITGANTGGTTNDHTHANPNTNGETGHSHSHSHSSTVSAGAANPTIDAFSTGWETTSVIGTTVNPSVNANATGSSGHIHGQGSTGGQSADHTHALNLAQVLGITDAAAPVNPGITVAVDGADVTTTLGGPFNSNVIELDVTRVLQTGVKQWHVLALQPNQKVRITGILRISYYVDNRLAQ